jgi:hypothetical protein
LGQSDKFIRFSSHCRDDDDDLIALVFGVEDPSRHISDALNIPDRGTAILLNHQRHPNTPSSNADCACLPQAGNVECGM